MPNDSSFSIGKIKSFVDKFFKLFNNFIDGYSVSGDKVTKESGGVKSSIVLKGENGNPDLRIDLIATNVSSAFKKDIQDIDKLNGEEQSTSNIDPNLIPKFENLVGKGCFTDEGNGVYSGNISLKAAIDRGDAGLDGGRLGLNFNKLAKTDALKTSDAFKKYWWKKATSDMRYTLICEAGNYDGGKVSNIKLLDVPKYIYQYIDVINGVDSNLELPQQSSRDEKVEKNKNTNTTALILVIPILDVIQNELRKLYQEKLNTDTSLDKFIPGNENNSNNSEDDFDEDALKDVEDETEKTAQQQQAQQQGGNPTAMQHIDVTLKKVQASDEIDILRLESNYNPGETLSDIDEIINQEEFLNTLTEEPQAFAIEVDEDGFDVEPCAECPECSPCASLCEVFKAGIRAYRNFYIIHWMSHGNDMMKLHILAEDMYSEMIQEIDTLGELLVEKQGTVPQLDFACDYIPVQQYDFQTGLDQIKSLIQMYIDCIDYAYCNQDSDVQSTLDEWLRYWNKQINYFIKNQEEV